jgi:hypothetical protein
MKVVKLLELNGLGDASDQTIKSIDIIKAVLERGPPERGIDVSALRSRCRVLDKLEAVIPGEDELVLEDADYATLVNAVSDFRFGIANKGLLAIINAILDAETTK